MVASRTALLTLLLAQLQPRSLADIGHHEELCRIELRPLMLRSKDGSPDRRLTVDADTVVLVPSATEGPFFTTVDDFYESRSLIEAAYSTGPGMTADRSTVIDLVPLDLTLNLYSVTGTTAEELAGATVYLWGADGLGRYSAVSSSMNSEDTSGTKWMRSKYTSNSDGQVTFQAALPGWYQGRSIHYHVRIGLPSDSTSFVITTQLFFDQDEIGDALKARSPYSSITTAMTSLTDDTVYPNMDSSTRASMILSLTGSMDAGYTATFNLGIDSSDLGDDAPVASVDTTTTQEIEDNNETTNERTTTTADAGPAATTTTERERASTSGREDTVSSSTAPTEKEAASTTGEPTSTQEPSSTMTEQPASTTEEPTSVPPTTTGEVAASSASTVMLLRVAIASLVAAGNLISVYGA